MKTLATVMVLAMAAASFGGVVRFVGPTEISVGTPVVFGIQIESTGVFSGTDIAFSTNDIAYENFSFQFGAYPWNILTGPQAGFGLTGKTTEYYVGGVNTTATAVTGPVLDFGTLTLSNLTEGIYSIDILGAGIDLISGAGSADGVDDLMGTVSFTVTPEPATMALLALGGLLIARRRQA